MIEPGGAWGRNLVSKVKITPTHHHKSRILIAAVAKAAQLDAAAIERRMIKGVDILEAYVMGPAINAINDGVGFYREFIMQSRLHETADNRRALFRGLMTKSSKARSIPLSVKARSIVLMISPRKGLAHREGDRVAVS